MSGETVITVVGNLVDDPELRFTPAGAAVAKFRVASTPRVFDKQSNEWKDGEGLFLSCSVWRQAAEHVAESLQKGMRVIVQGRLKQRSYEDREGVKRTVYELDVDDVGPSLKSATAKVTKASSSGSGGQGREEFQRARQEQGRSSAEDPWASDTPGTGGAPAGGWGSGSQGGGHDDPPF
ncbi:single-stranded DNA-binding protein [Streptomyces anulatus]